MPTIAPGDNWQAAINANPNGTVFGILGDPGDPHLGTNAAHIPKPGNQFIADTKWVPGSTAHPVIDGQSTTGLDGTQYFTQHAASGTQPDNVVYDGLEIKRFRAAAQQGVIKAGDGASRITTGWILRDLYIHDSYHLGIRTGNGMQILGSAQFYGPGARRFLIDNIKAVGSEGNPGALGMGGTGDNIIVKGVEVANTNPGHLGSLDFETGGTKFVRTSNLEFAYNYTHDNYGPGWWADICNVGYNVHDNWAEREWRNAYTAEISYGGHIHHNGAFLCGLSDTRSSGWNGAIFLSSSGGDGIEVNDNWLYGNRDGLVAWQSPRGAAFGDPAESDGPYLTQNVYFHDNVDIAPPGLVDSLWHLSGALDDSGSSMGPVDAIFNTRNNVWDANTYVLPHASPSGFAWDNAERTWAAFQAFGQEANGRRLLSLGKYRGGSD